MKITVGHISLRGNGAAAWPGWPVAPKIEALREAWMEAADLPANGSRRLTFTVRYTLASGGSSSAFDVSVVAVDEESGIQVGGTVRVNIA